MLLARVARFARSDWAYTLACLFLSLFAIFLIVVSYGVTGVDAAANSPSRWYTDPIHNPAAMAVPEKGPSHALETANVDFTQRLLSDETRRYLPSRTDAQWRAAGSAYRVEDPESASIALASVLSIEPSGYIGFGEVRSPLTIVGLFLANVTAIYVDNVSVLFTVASQYSVTILSIPAHPDPPMSIFCFTNAVTDYDDPLGTLTSKSTAIDSSAYLNCDPVIRPVEITITTSKRQSVSPEKMSYIPVDTPNMVQNWTTVLNGVNMVPMLARHSGYTPVLLGISGTVQVMQRRVAYLPVETRISPAELWRSTVMAIDDTERFSYAIRSATYYLSTPSVLTENVDNVTDAHEKASLFIQKFAEWRVTTRLAARLDQSTTVGNRLQEREAELVRFNARIGYMSFSPVRVFTTSQYVQEELLRQLAAANKTSANSVARSEPVVAGTRQAWRDTNKTRPDEVARADGARIPRNEQGLAGVRIRSRVAREDVQTSRSRLLPDMLWELYNIMYTQIRVTLLETAISNASLQWSVGPAIGCDAISTVTASIPHPHHRYGLAHVLPSMDSENQILAIPATHFISSAGLRMANTTALLARNNTFWVPFGRSGTPGEPAHRLQADGTRRYFKPGTRSRSSDVRRAANFHRLRIYGAFSRGVPYVPGEDVLPSGDIGERKEVDIRLHRLRQPPWLHGNGASSETGPTGPARVGTRVALRLEEETPLGIAPCYVIASDEQSYTCEVGVIPFAVDATDTTSASIAPSSDASAVGAEERHATSEGLARSRTEEWNAHRVFDSCGAGTAVYAHWSNSANPNNSSEREWHIVEPFPVVINSNALYMIRDILLQYPSSVGPIAKAAKQDAATPSRSPVVPLIRFTFSFAVENTYNGSYHLHCYGNAGHGVAVHTLYERLTTAADNTTTTSPVMAQHADICQVRGAEELEVGGAFAGGSRNTATSTPSSASSLWLQSARAPSNITINGHAVLNLTCTFTAADLLNATLLEGAYCGVSLEALKVDKTSFKPPVRPFDGFPQLHRTGLRTGRAPEARPDEQSPDARETTPQMGSSTPIGLYTALVIELVVPIEPHLGGRPVDPQPPLAHRMHVTFSDTSRMGEDAHDGDSILTNDFVVNLPRPRSSEECLHMRRDLYFSVTANQTGPRWSFVSGIPARRRPQSQPTKQPEENQDESDDSRIDYQCTWFVATVLDTTVPACAHANIHFTEVSSTVLVPGVSPEAQIIYCGSRSHFLDPITALQTRVPLNVIPQLVDLDQLVEPLMPRGQGSTPGEVNIPARGLVRGGLYQFCVDVRSWWTRSPLLSSSASPYGPLIYHLYDIEAAVQTSDWAGFEATEAEAIRATYTFDPSITLMYSVPYAKRVFDATLSVDNRIPLLESKPTIAVCNDSVYFTGHNFVFQHAQTGASLFTNAILVYMIPMNGGSLAYIESGSTMWPSEIPPLHGVVLNASHVFLSVLETVPGGWYNLTVISGDYGLLRGDTGLPLTLVVRTTVTSINVPDASGLVGGASIIIRGNNLPLYELDPELFTITLGRAPILENIDKADEGEEAPVCAITSSTTRTVTCTMPAMTEQWLRANAYGTEPGTGNLRVPIIISIYYRHDDHSRRLLQRITTRAPPDDGNHTRTSPSSPSSSQSAVSASTDANSDPSMSDMWLYAPVHLTSAVVHSVSPSIVSMHAPKTVFTLRGEGLSMSTLILCRSVDSKTNDPSRAALSCATCLPAVQGAGTTTMTCTVRGQMAAGVYDVRFALEPFTTLPITVESVGAVIIGAASPSVIYPYGRHFITLAGTGFYCADRLDDENVTALVTLSDLSIVATVAATVTSCTTTALSVTLPDLGFAGAVGATVRISAGGYDCVGGGCVVTVLPDHEMPRITAISPSRGQAPLILALYGTGFTKLAHSPLRKADAGVSALVYVDVVNGRCEPVDVLNTVLLCNMSEPCASINGQQPVQIVSSYYGRTRNTESDAALHFECTMAVNGVSPPQGSLYGGQQITITGVGFPADPSMLQVTLAGVNCTITALTSTTIGCVAGAARRSVTGVVNVFNTASKVSASCCQYAYKFDISPTVTTITPNSAIRGSYVTVRGSGFFGLTADSSAWANRANDGAYRVDTKDGSFTGEAAAQPTTSRPAVQVFFGQEIISVVPSSDTSLEFTVKDSYGMDHLTVSVPGLGKTLPSPGTLTVSMTPAIVKPSSGGFFGRSLITLVGTTIDNETSLESLGKRLEVWVCGRQCVLASTSESGEIQCIVPEYWDMELVQEYVSYLTFSRMTSGYTEYYLRTSFAKSAKSLAQELAARSPEDVQLWGAAALFKSTPAAASSAVTGTIYYIFEANPHSRILINEIYFTLRPLSGDPLDLSKGQCELLIPTAEAMQKPFDVHTFGDPQDERIWNSSARHTWAPLAVGVNSLSFADSSTFPVSPHFGFHCTGILPDTVVLESAGINGYQVGLQDSGGECPVDIVSIPSTSSTLPGVHSCASRTGVACATYVYDITMTPIVTGFAPSYILASDIGAEATLTGVGFGNNIADISEIILDNVLFTPVNVSDKVLVCRLVGDVLGSAPTMLTWNRSTSHRGAALILSQQPLYTPVSWSSLLAWGGAAPPEGGAVRTMPTSRSVLLDTSPPPLTSITIYGTLIVSHLVDVDLTTTSLNILEGGVMFAGSAASPRTRRFNINLDLIDAEDSTSAYGSEEIRQFPTQKRLHVQGGSLQLYGAVEKSCTVLLDSTAAIGTTHITLSSRVRWAVGAAISITSTTVLAKEAEIRTIVYRKFNGTKTILTLDSPLRFEHKTYTNSDISPNFRSSVENVTAYLAPRVVLLSRTVQIQGGPSSSVSYIGGIARVETVHPVAFSGVGFYRMGQLGTANGFGVWLRDVHFTTSQLVLDHAAVHEAYFRGVVLSNSQHVTISNTTFHEVEGYGVAAIGAVHRSLSLFDNFIHSTGAFRGGLDPTPGGMIFTYPTANIQGNMISASEGNGVWYALRQTYAGANSRTCPSQAPLGTFIWNSILRVRRHGVFIFPVQFATASTCASNLFAVFNEDESSVRTGSGDGSSGSEEAASGRGSDSNDSDNDDPITPDDDTHIDVATGIVSTVVNGSLILAGTLKHNMIISCGLHGLYLPPSSSYRIVNTVISDCGGSAVYADFSTNLTVIEFGLLTDTAPSGSRTNLSERQMPRVDPLNTRWENRTLDPPGADDPPAVFAMPTALQVRHGGFVSLFGTTLGSYADATLVVLLALPRTSHSIYAHTTMAYYAVLESGDLDVWGYPEPAVILGGQTAIHDHDGSLVSISNDVYLLSGASYLRGMNSSCSAHSNSSTKVVSVNEARSLTLTRCYVPTGRLGLFTIITDTLMEQCDPQNPSCHRINLNVTSEAGSFELDMGYPNDNYIAVNRSVLPTVFYFVDDFDVSIFSSAQPIANGGTPSRGISFYSDNLSCSFSYRSVTEDGQRISRPDYPNKLAITYFTLGNLFQVSTTFYVEVSPSAVYFEANNLFITTMTRGDLLAGAQDDGEDGSAAQSMTLPAPPIFRRFIGFREYNASLTHHADTTNRSWSTAHVFSCPVGARCMPPSYPYLSPSGRATVKDLAIARGTTEQAVENDWKDFDFFDADAWLDGRGPWVLYSRAAGDMRVFTIPAGHRVTLTQRNATVDGALVVMGMLIIKAADNGTRATGSGVLVLRCESIAVFGLLHVVADQATSQRVDIRLGYMAPTGSPYSTIEAEAAAGMEGYKTDPTQYTCYNRSRAVRLSRTVRLYCGALLVAGEAYLQGATPAPTTWRAQDLITPSASSRALPSLVSIANRTNADIFTSASTEERHKRLPHWFYYVNGVNESVDAVSASTSTRSDQITPRNMQQGNTSDISYRSLALAQGEWLAVASSSQTPDEEELQQVSADVTFTHTFKTVVRANRITRRVTGVTDIGFVTSNWKYKHGIRNIISSGIRRQKFDGDDYPVAPGDNTAQPPKREDGPFPTDSGKIYSEVVFLAKKIELNCLIPETAATVGCQVIVREQPEPANMFTKPNFTAVGVLVRHFGKSGTLQPQHGTRRERFFLPAVYVNATGAGGASLSGSVVYESFATAVYVSPFATDTWLVDTAVVRSYGGGVRVDAATGVFMCGVVVMGTRYTRDDPTHKSSVPVLTISDQPFATASSLRPTDLEDVQSLCSILLNYTTKHSTTELRNSVAAGSESEGFCLPWDMNTTLLVAHSNAVGVFLYSQIHYQSPVELAQQKWSGWRDNVSTFNGTSDCGTSTLCGQNYVSTFLPRRPLSVSEVGNPVTDADTIVAVQMAHMLSYMNRFIGVYSSAVDAIELEDAHVIANPIGVAISISPLFGDGTLFITDSFLSTAPICDEEYILSCAPSPLWPSAAGVGCGPLAFVDTTYNYTDLYITPSYQQRSLNYNRSIPLTAVTADAYEMDVWGLVVVSRTEFGGVGVYDCPAVVSRTGITTIPAHVQRSAGIMGNGGTVTSSSVYLITVSGTVYSEVARGLTTMSALVPSAAVMTPSSAASAPAPMFIGPVWTIPENLKCGRVACFPFRETILRDGDGTLFGTPGKYMNTDGSLRGMCHVYPLAPKLALCPGDELQCVTLRGLDDRTKVLTTVNFSFSLQLTTATASGETTEEVSESVVAIATTQSPSVWYAYPHNASAPSNSEIKRVVPLGSVDLSIPVDRYPDVFQVATSDCSMVPNNVVVLISLPILDVSKSISVWDVGAGRRAALSTTLPESYTISRAQTSTGVTSWNLESSFDPQTGVESMRLNLLMTCAKALEVHQQVYGLMTLYTPQPPSVAERGIRFLESRLAASTSDGFPAPIICLSGQIGVRVVDIHPNPYSKTDAFIVARVEWMDSLNYNVTAATEGINAFLGLLSNDGAGLATPQIPENPTRHRDIVGHRMSWSASSAFETYAAHALSRSITASPGGEFDVTCSLRSKRASSEEATLESFYVSNVEYLVTSRSPAYTPAEYAASRQRAVDDDDFFEWQPSRLAAYVVVVLCLLLMGLALTVTRSTLKHRFVAYFTASNAASATTNTVGMTSASTAVANSGVWRRGLDVIRRTTHGFSITTYRRSNTSLPSTLQEVEMGTVSGPTPALRRVAPDVLVTGLPASRTLAELVADPHAANIAAAREFERDLDKMEEEERSGQVGTNPLVAFELNAGTPSPPPLALMTKTDPSAAADGLPNKFSSTDMHAPRDGRPSPPRTPPAASRAAPSANQATSAGAPPTVANPLAVLTSSTRRPSLEDGATRRGGNTMQSCAMTLQRLPDSWYIPSERTNPDSSELARKDYYVQLWRVAPVVSDVLERQTRSRPMPHWEQLRAARPPATAAAARQVELPRFLNRPATSRNSLFGTGTYGGGVAGALALQPVAMSPSTATAGRAKLRTESLFAPPFAHRPKAPADGNYVAVGLTHPAEVSAHVLDELQTNGQEGDGRPGDVYAEAQSSGVGLGGAGGDWLRAVQVDSINGREAVAVTTQNSTSGSAVIPSMSGGDAFRRSDGTGVMHIQPILMTRPLGAVGAPVPARGVPGRVVNVPVPVYTSPHGEIAFGASPAAAGLLWPPSSSASAGVRDAAGSRTAAAGPCSPQQHTLPSTPPLLSSEPLVSSADGNELPGEGVVTVRGRGMVSFATTTEQISNSERALRARAAPYWSKY